MTHIIGYTYQCDPYCPGCIAELMFDEKVGCIKGFDPENVDEHCVPVACADEAGNIVHPILSSDEQLDDLWCNGCSALILEIAR